MKTPKTKKKMSLCLEETEQGTKIGWPGLGDAIDEALEALHGKEKTGHALTIQSARRWLAERAIRAVCTMIVRDRGMCLPLRLSQSFEKGLAVSAAPISVALSHDDRSKVERVALLTGLPFERILAELGAETLNTLDQYADLKTGLLSDMVEVWDYDDEGERNEALRRIREAGSGWNFVLEEPKTEAARVVRDHFKGPRRVFFRAYDN